jgi:integrase
LQRGSLTKFFDKRKRVWVWRFQWREPGFKGPRTRDLGRCSDVSRANARQAADAILQRVQGSVPEPRSSIITLQQFVEDTYLDVKTRKWKDSTRGTTEQIIEDYILRPLGNELLHSLTRKRLQCLLDELAAGDKSSSIVGHVRWQLSAIFNMACADGLISVNPTLELQTPPCKPQKEKRVMTAQDFAWAQMCLELRERLIFLLALGQAFRPGEIMALKCRDIQQDGFHVERRIYRRVIDTPKSKNGTRVVPYTDPVKRALDEYLKILPDNSPDAWLFPSENGATPLDYANVFRRRIRPALAKIGLGWVNFQVMRRTAANELKEVESDPRVRADIMGHSVDVHENEYRQSSLKAKQRAMKRLGSRLQ